METKPVSDRIAEESKGEQSLRDKVRLFLCLPYVRQHRIGRDLGMLPSALNCDGSEMEHDIIEYVKACGFQEQFFALVRREVAEFTSNA